MQCKICVSADQFYDIITQRDVELQRIKVVNENCVIVNYRYQSGFVPEIGPGNIYIASFTTAHARLKLLSVIGRLKERALYCDTGNHDQAQVCKYVNALQTPSSLKNHTTEDTTQNLGTFWVI